MRWQRRKRVNYSETMQNNAIHKFRDLCCSPKTPLNCISAPLLSYFENHIETWDCLVQSWPLPNGWGSYEMARVSFFAIYPITPLDNASYGSAMNAITSPCTTSPLTPPQDTAAKPNPAGSAKPTDNHQLRALWHHQTETATDSMPG